MVSVMPTFRAHRAPAGFGFLLLTLAACSTWQVGTPTPMQFVEREKPAHIRVTRTDGTTLMLARPIVVGDSLLGAYGGVVGGSDTARTIHLGAGEIRSVATHRVSTGRTLLAIGGGMVLIGAIVAASGGLDMMGDLNGMGGTP